MAKGQEKAAIASRKGNFFQTEQQKYRSAKKPREKVQSHASSSGSFFVKPTIASRKEKFFQTGQQKNKSSKKPKEEFQSSASSSGSFFVKSVQPKVSQKSNLRNINVGQEKKQSKKQFDKKTWQLQTFSKKYKLQQWEEKRKKTILKEYYRTVGDSSMPNKTNSNLETPKNDVNEVNTEQQNNNKNLNKGTKKRNAYKQANTELQRIEEEKKKEKIDRALEKEEQKKARLELKKKRVARFRNMNKKTKKGQPLMKGRIEMLLEKIQNSVTN